MNRYTIYCTEEQTKKALELGAPILSFKNAITRKEIPHFEIGNKKNWTLYFIPIAEQMIGWLEEQGFEFEWCYNYTSVDYKNKGCIGMYGGNRKEATLVAIDAALEYIETKKNEI